MNVVCVWAVLAAGPVGLPAPVAARQAEQGFIGVELTPDTDSGKPTITKVLKGKPADKGGLKVGDVILKLNETPILSVSDLIDMVQAATPDKEVTFTVRRGKETKEIKVKVGKKE